MSKIDCAKDAVADAIENRRESKLPKDKGLDYAMELLYEIKPITEHPDVQRLIGQVVELQAEIKGLKDLFKIVRARSMDYAHRTGEYHRDLSIIHESAVEALKGNTND